ncbi:hypothetical protein T12_12796 [Trichinella patagoniensis]|uniref:Uncharacterized protein n=1 Tax=Trichinella patagoniensis TaxID=990121 RepID=A0A0V0ZRM8_9BILA|nr:hypothetical protein T12_12796 [Trichinella patagoniensis]
MELSGVFLHSKIQNHCHAGFDENGFDVGNILDVELYSSLIELLLLEKILACVMIHLTAPGFVKTFPRIFDRDIPEQEYPFSYFNQAKDHAHSHNSSDTTQIRRIRTKSSTKNNRKVAELVSRVTTGLILMNLTVNTFIKALQKIDFDVYVLLDYFTIKRFPYGNDGMFSSAFTITR